MLTNKRKGHTMSVNDKKRLESVLAFHAAPTLMGVKCGSLLSLSAEEYDRNEISALFESGSLGRCSALITGGHAGRILVYIYDRGALEGLLSDDDVREFLSYCGYERSLGCGECLDILSKRLCERDFPHEIGIFLGYPLEDVKGFIANCGKRCKLCGVWKVYGDVERAKALFKCYENCRVRLCRELENGKQLRSCVA